MKNGSYILVVCPKEYPGKRYRGKYVYEHHLNWWRKSGVPPRYGQVVHHINGIKTDNRFDNLELLTSSEHGRHHASHKRTTLIELVCDNCQKSFLREKRQFKRRYKNYYCGRSCMGSHQMHTKSRVP